MRMSSNHLRKFYTSINIWYRKPNVKMWGNKEDYHHSCDKLKFILKMADVLKKGTQLIWLDETTVNQWGSRVDKIWQQKDAPIDIRLPERGCSVTIYGALFSYKGKLRYSTGKHTCTEEFIPFLESKVLPFITNKDNAYLVMDNHPAHHSNKTQAWLK